MNHSSIIGKQLTIKIVSCFLLFVFVDKETKWRYYIFVSKETKIPLLKGEHICHK